MTWPYSTAALSCRKLARSRGMINTAPTTDPTPITGEQQTDSDLTINTDISFDKRNRANLRETVRPSHADTYGVTLEDTQRRARFTNRYMFLM